MAFAPSTLPLLHASTPTHASTILSLISLSHIKYDPAFFASWSATWSLIRAWVPPLREESFPSVTNLSPNSPLPPYKAQVIRTWLLINAASAKLQHHLHRAVLPSHDKIPSFFHPLEMVRMNPLPNRQFLPKPPPTTLLRATRTASSLLVSSTFNLPSKSKLLSPHLFLPLPSLMCFNPRLTRAKRDSSMAPLSMDHRRGMLECPSPSGSAISSREPTRSQLGLLICSLAPHISLIKTAYRAPSNQQVSTVYPSEPMRVTSCAAVKGSVSMVLSVTGFGMSSASSSNAAGSARLLSVICLIDR